MFDFDNTCICISVKTECNVVSLYNCRIIFCDKHFEDKQDEHSTESISFQTQFFDSTFVDKLLKCV